MSLTSRLNNPDRIDAFYRDHVARTNPEPIVEPVLVPAVLHRDGNGGRVPRWIERKNEQGIARDETGRAA